jgi:hypothetical protein
VILPLLVFPARGIIHDRNVFIIQATTHQNAVLLQEVTERHEAVMGQLMSGDVKNQNIPGLDGILRGEIMRKDALIRQLMEQNKMLLMAKEKQEVEMNAQEETLEVRQI